MIGLTPYMHERLLQRDLNQQTRKLIVQKPGTFDFSSNDYISFARSSILKERILQRMQDMTCVGASGSRLLTGNFPLAEEVEAQVAEFFGFPKALIFPCGFTLNASLLAAFADEHDSIIMDENVHASLKTGLKLASAPGYFFRHNDLNQLESRLIKQRSKQKNIFVVVESLYSMDGDIVDVEELLKLCEHYDARLIIDEAHAIGAVGKGRGFVGNSNHQDKVFACVTPFGKAFGCHGAALLGSKELIHYAVNFCHSFMYTTGLPAFSFIALQEAMRLFDEDSKPLDTLQDNIKTFNQALNIQNNISPIYSFPFDDIEKLRFATKTIQEQGFHILPIYSPTVRRGSERLRVSVHAHNTQWELETCAKELLRLCH